MFSVSNKQLPGTITYDYKTATAWTSQKFIFWIVQRINMTDRLTKKMSVIWPVGKKVDCYIHAKCYLQSFVSSKGYSFTSCPFALFSS